MKKWKTFNQKLKNYNNNLKSGLWRLENNSFTVVWHPCVGINTIIRMIALLVKMLQP